MEVSNFINFSFLVYIFEKFIPLKPTVSIPAPSPKGTLQSPADPPALSNLAKGSLVRKKDQLLLALHGRFSMHHQFMLQLILGSIHQIDATIQRVGQQIDTYLDLDGTLVRIIEQAGTPNGILISPDQEILYVASINFSFWSELNAVIKFELDNDENASNEMIFIDFKGEPGPEGIAIDLDGNLYLARPGNAPAIYIYSPEGAQIGFISTLEQPSNVTFSSVCLTYIPIFRTFYRYLYYLLKKISKYFNNLIIRRITKSSDEVLGCNVAVYYVVRPLISYELVTT